jgi:hypothetical protein
MRAEQEQRHTKESDEISTRTLLLHSTRSDGPEALTAILKAYDPDAEMVLSLCRAGQLPSHLKMSWLTGRHQPEEEAPKVAQRPVVQLDGRMALPKEARMPGYEASVMDRLRNAQRQRQSNSS